MGKEHQDLAKQLDTLSSILKEEKECREKLSITLDDLIKAYDDKANKAWASEHKEHITADPPKKPDEVAPLAPAPTMTQAKEQANKELEDEKRNKIFKIVLIVGGILSLVTGAFPLVIVAFIIYAVVLSKKGRTTDSGVFACLKQDLFKNVSVPADQIEQRANSIYQGYMNEYEQKKQKHAVLVANYNEAMRVFEEETEAYPEKCRLTEEYNKSVDEFNDGLKQLIKLGKETVPAQYQEMIDENQKKLDELLESKKQFDGLLPEQYYDVIEMISQEIKDYKAESIKEAINKYEEDSREAEKLREMVRHNKEIERQNIAANQQIILDNELHNKNMEQIRQNEAELQKHYNDIMQQRNDAEAKYHKEEQDRYRKEQKERDARQQTIKRATSDLQMHTREYESALQRGDQSAAAYYHADMERDKAIIQGNAY